MVQRVFGVQLSPAEITLISAAISAYEPCRLLIFGLGNDSSLWRRLNQGGTTVFLEDDPFWIDVARRHDPLLTAECVRYSTRLENWKQDIVDPAALGLVLPDGVESGRWDVIVVDAPRGHRPHHPGRLQSIYTASQLVTPRGLVLVHDCHREPERRFSRELFGAPILKMDLLMAFSPALSHR